MLTQVGGIMRDIEELKAQDSLRSIASIPVLDGGTYALGASWFVLSGLVWIGAMYFLTLVVRD